MAKNATLPPGIEDDGEGYGDHDGPDSQGGWAGEGFEGGRQGTYGDEDYDPSYEREGEGDLVNGSIVRDDVAAIPGVLPGTQLGDRPDDGIVEEVTERLTEDLELDPADVLVRADGGIVVLEGIVETQAIRDAAERIAGRVAGVRGVENQLRERD